MTVRTTTHDYERATTMTTEQAVWRPSGWTKTPSTTPHVGSGVYKTREVRYPVTVYPKKYGATAKKRTP